MSISRMVFFVPGLAVLNIMFGLLVIAIAVDYSRSREDPVIIVKHINTTTDMQNGAPPSYYTQYDQNRK